MPSRRTITIVTSHYFPHPGGVERFAGLQANECMRLGFHVRIVTHDTERLGFMEESPGITIYRLKCWSPFPHNRFPIPTSIPQLYRVVKTLLAEPSAATIIHTRFFLSSLLGCIIARCSGSRLAVIDHGSGYAQLGGPLLRALSRIYEHLITLAVLAFRPQMFGVSKASVAWLRRFGIRRARVCYNAIDVHQRPANPKPMADIIGPAASKKVVLAVGRLVREKGFMELVTGFEKFAAARDDYVLVLAGHGELEGELRSAAARNSKILFLGRQPLDDVLSMMTQAHVLVNPSNYPEGLPTILLEAGVCGLAAISTPAGGAAEIITDGETGILIERGESDRIAAALQRLDETPKLRERIAGRLQQLVRTEFSSATTTERLLFRDLELPR